MTALSERKPSGGLESPASQAFTVAPSDDADLSRNTRGIICSEAGTVRCTFVNDVDDTYVDIAVLGGVLYPFRLKRVWDTGTSEIDIVAVL